MPQPEYRPWGLASWLVPRLSVSNWALLGCIGTEERSLSAWNTVIPADSKSRATMLRITDVPSRHTSQSNNLLTLRTSNFLSLGGDSARILDHKINDTLHLIKTSLDAFLADSGQSIVLDVTSMPKRFFFPLIRFLLREGAHRIQNLIVTYTVPAEYTKEKLAENVDDWECLPMFGGINEQESAKLLAVAVGFEGLGLHEHFDPGTSLHPIKLLIPFPAPAQAFKRSWELLHKLTKLRSPDLFEVHRVDAKDMADTFERILSLSRNNTISVDLAPFGPKPTSLGMCVFAALTNSRVFYTQPRTYHPEYSKGVSMLKGQPEIYSYCLRLGGRDIYKIS